MKQLNNEAIVSPHFESLYPPQSRFKEIDKIVQYIQAGNSCQLISLPGVGRSNLLELLSYNHGVRVAHLADNQKWFHFVYMNMAEVKEKTLPDVIKFIFLELADSLRDRNLTLEHDKVHAIFQQHMSFNDEMVLFQGLKEAIHYLSLEKELTVVLLLDRFEDYIPALSSQFFTNLRTLRDMAKYRFSALFSLSRPIEDTIDASILLSFHEFLANHVVYLNLSDTPSLQFRISYIEKSLQLHFEKSLIDAVVQLTGGHGKLTRVCIEELAPLVKERKELSNTVLLDFFVQHARVRAVLSYILNTLTPSEQNSLTAKDYTSQPYLTSTGLIADNHIAIPLFEAFIKETAQVNQLQLPILFNKQTNEITQGNHILSDKLTSFEFRLLTFLLKNTDRIIDRDEIIKAVWKENSSTIGVSDQALDQLVFRVRKKIEEDPNNPIHLQTVKGRGFKFSP